MHNQAKSYKAFRICLRITGDRAEDVEAERLARITLKTEAKIREMMQEEED
jgi:hypothetical protein